ncbi:cysteine and histidine-rich domain-containing protein morgana-like [Macrosteles quadrilineatus]|uniref:cysteine and histidine-rich domain-containing protein morgana-like n=1 Tax=Macrosteles quadrilineatus TaxID=74068 RepID=UPI0023E22BFB|nr:cysteine and histidine-rich domain-containing protein morgana-like [Macrosteles quadrilineatus]
MPSDEGLVLCYNKGCGKTFDPNANKSDSCVFHPGVPVFHDAYKGWSCCKKKCTDFTEFLNIKGCTTSCHNNVKPEEPQKPVVDKSKAAEVIEYRAPKPFTEPTVERPSFDSPMTTMVPAVSDVLRQQVAACKQGEGDVTPDNSQGGIPVGTACKNNACKVTYEGPETLKTPCVHHPGYAVFHEGLKFWSCCTKRTTDFNAFLEQVGCRTDEHVWFKSKGGSSVKCRLDWHQTGSAVYVSVFAKKYDPEQSYIQLSPVRLKMSLYFPEQDSYYTNDLELRGIVKVEGSSVQMLPTKVEVKLKKTSGASWSTLDIPRAVPKPATPPEVEEKPDVTLEEQVDAVDLSDL